MVTALDYAFDKEIDDIEEPPFQPTHFDVDQDPIALPRVDTEDLIVHVHLDDGWHRMAPDGTETACGRYIDVRLMLAERPGRTIEHPLAEKCDCWTRHERAKADEAYRKKWGRPYVPWTRAPEPKP